MQTVINKTIVPWKLGKELQAAGIAHNGMSLFPGNVLDIALVNEAQAPQAQTVINAHDSIDTMLSRQAVAEATAKNIPNWAKWSQQDWTTYRDANISATQINAVASLADAKVIMNKMALVLDSLAKMEIALRDQIWPDIPEG